MSFFRALAVVPDSRPGGKGQSRRADVVPFLFKFCGTGLDGGVQLPSRFPSGSCSEGMDRGFFCRVSW
jgi:hypothetical protein